MKDKGPMVVSEVQVLVYPLWLVESLYLRITNPMPLCWIIISMFTTQCPWAQNQAFKYWNLELVCFVCIERSSSIHSGRIQFLRVLSYFQQLFYIQVKRLTRWKETLFRSALALNPFTALVCLYHSHQFDFAAVKRHRLIAYATRPSGSPTIPYLFSI